MDGLILFLLAVLIIFLVYLTFQFLGGILLGAKIEEIGLLLGPSIFKFNLTKSIKFSLNFIPFGSYIKFTDEYAALHPAAKIFIILVGLLSYVTIAVICIGFSEAAAQVYKGFGQLIWGAISPVAVGAKYVDALLYIFASESFSKGLGILTSKFLSQNLFPLSVLSGGMILLNLLEMVGIKSEKFNEKFGIAGILLIFLFALCWAIAFGASLLT